MLGKTRNCRWFYLNVADQWVIDSFWTDLNRSGSSQFHSAVFEARPQSCLQPSGSTTRGRIVLLCCFPLQPPNNSTIKRKSTSTSKWLTPVFNLQQPEHRGTNTHSIQTHKVPDENRSNNEKPKRTDHWFTVIKVIMWLFSLMHPFKMKAASIKATTSSTSLPPLHSRQTRLGLVVFSDPLVGAWC